MDHQKPLRQHGLTGGKGEIRRSDFQLMERAFRNRWGLTDEERRQVIDQLLRDNQAAATARDRTAAARALIAADNVNARREGHEVAERGQDVSASAAVMRGVLASQGARAIVAAMAGELCNPPPTALESGQTQASAPPESDQIQADPPLVADAPAADLSHLDFWSSEAFAEDCGPG